MFQDTGDFLNLRLKRSIKNLGLLIAGLLIAGLLAACGSDDRVLHLATSTPGPAAQAGLTAPPAATPEATSTAGTAPATTPAATSTATVVATPTAAPTSPPAPTNTPAPPTNSPAPTTGPTAQPTANAPPVEAPAKIDAAAELKVIRAAYDAINQHFYTQPDTAKLAQKGLEEAARMLNVAPPPALAWSDPAANWQLFEEQFQQMAAKTQVQLPPGDVAHRVVGALALAVGDLHTYFLDKKRTDTIQRMGRGDNSTVGFGLMFVQYQNGYYVQRFVTGSPGQLAGAKVGDRLLKFDGVDLNAANFSRLANATEGMSYEFVFQPWGGGSPITRTIEYKRYKVPTVEWQVLKDHIGVITINAFHQDVALRLDEALAAVKAQGADSLVIDLRYNGGGYNFDRVAGRFVANGTVLGNFVNRKGSFNIKARSEGKQVKPALPLVVLIERNSASASEVFSLAIRDFQAGTLMGGKSAGAIGTVAYWPLGDGTSLAVTNSVYESVKGARLNGVGITPDVPVTRTTEDILSGRDPQLQAAVSHLEDKFKVTN